MFLVIPSGDVYYGPWLAMFLICMWETAVNKADFHFRGAYSLANSCQIVDKEVQSPFSSLSPR